MDKDKLYEELPSLKNKDIVIIHSLNCTNENLNLIEREDIIKKHSDSYTSYISKKYSSSDNVFDTSITLLIKNNIVIDEILNFISKLNLKIEIDEVEIYVAPDELCEILFCVK